MPRYFLSYRRNDKDGAVLAHMVFRELKRKYGSENTFFDVDSRNPGMSFPTKVADALSKTDAVLVIIGPDWLKELNARANEPHDWVRYEVSESLKQAALPVVPICREGVEMPKAEHLPSSLAGLADRDGIFLDPFSNFEAHLARLLIDLERVIAEQSELRSKGLKRQKNSESSRKAQASTESERGSTHEAAQVTQVSAASARAVLGRIGVSCFAAFVGYGVAFFAAFVLMLLLSATGIWNPPEYETVLPTTILSYVGAVAGGLAGWRWHHHW